MKLLNRLFEPPAEQREAWARVKDMHEWLKRIDAAINGNGQEGLKVATAKAQASADENSRRIKHLAWGVGLGITSAVLILIAVIGWVLK